MFIAVRPLVHWPAIAAAGWEGAPSAGWPSTDGLGALRRLRSQPFHWLYRLGYIFFIHHLEKIDFYCSGNLIQRYACGNIFKGVYEAHAIYLGGYKYKSYKPALSLLLIAWTLLGTTWAQEAATPAPPEKKPKHGYIRFWNMLPMAPYERNILVVLAYHYQALLRM